MTDALLNSASTPTPASAIFISLELSRSTWLVTACRLQAERRCRNFRLLPAIQLSCFCDFQSCGIARSIEPETPFLLSPSRKLVWMASGCIAF